MNPGNIASSAASSAASGAATSAASNAVSGSNALKLESAASSSASSNIIDFPGNPSSSSAPATGGGDIIDFPGNSSTPEPPTNSTPEPPAPNNEEAPEPSNGGDGNGSDNGDGENPEEKKPEKQEPGKKTNGEDSSTKKMAKALARGTAAYFTGGESLQYDQAIANNGFVDKTLGVVADLNDKTNPATTMLNDALDEAGVIDTANDAMDLAGNVMNGDIGGTIEKGIDTVKDVYKVNMTLAKILAWIICPILFILFATVIIILGPVLGGFLTITDGLVGEKSAYSEYYSSSITPGDINNMVSDTPGYENLSPSRQAIIAASASLVGKSYNWGGHPSGPGVSGVPSKGLDCAGYVQWVLWTALGSNPGYLTTSAISNQIGSKFIIISPSDLKPGDIGLKRMGGSTEGNTNHTGIYAGDGYWYHAQGTNSGIVRNQYKSFKIYLRYVGVS